MWGWIFSGPAHDKVYFPGYSLIPSIWFLVDQTNTRPDLIPAAILEMIQCSSIEGVHGIRP